MMMIRADDVFIKPIHDEGYHSRRMTTSVKPCLMPKRFITSNNLLPICRVKVEFSRGKTFSTKKSKLFLYSLLR